MAPEGKACADSPGPPPATPTAPSAVTSVSAALVEQLVTRINALESHQAMSIDGSSYARGVVGLPLPGEDHRVTKSRDCIFYEKLTLPFKAHNYNNEGRRSPDAELPPPNTSQDTLRLGNESDDHVVKVTSFHDYDRLHYKKTNETGLRIPGLAFVVRHASPNEPTTVRQAFSGLDSKKWKAAMAAEVAAVKSRGTWKVVPQSLAKGRTILSGKWVFRIKTLADGSIDKYKERWVLRGFEQTHMVDFNLTYAPVGRHTSARIRIYIAAVKQRPLRQINVGSAFLYASVDAIIFVEQPHAFEESDGAVPS
ncbi:unnamed protein product [Closterium sp. NIES-53]